MDIVKLHLDPLIRTAERASQINSYLERVSKHQKYRIMISADCTDLEASEQKAFLTWSMKLNIYESPSCYTLENKPVIELTGATADLEIMGLHLRQRIWLRKHPLLKDSTYFKEAELSLDQTEIRIYAGYKSNLMWKVRRHPIAVRLAFREALQLNTSQVTISSWNHYTNGSFIEPNTYDDNRLFEALKLDITAFRQKTRRPDSGR